MNPAPLVDPSPTASRRVRAAERLPAALAVRRGLRTVHEVIDRRAVEVVFAPMVRPATGDVVGLEAAIRGLDGTAFTSARSLRHAAAAVGRLSELDWVGRAAAARALAQRAVDPSVALFFAADARVLYEPCPTDCLPLVRSLLTSRRCILRLDPGHSTTLAHAMVAGTDQLRAAGFEIAIDGPPMGVPSGSMLRCFDPELTTVDARALVTLTHRDGPRAVPALGEFYRRAGRQVVARHVEDAEGARLAGAMGAAFSQGPFHGRPAPLGTTRL